jgi:NADPH2:quinone reductase
MKAVRAERLDSIADYGLVEVDTPEPPAGQVRIAVAACGVGYVDALVALGRYQVKPALPHVPGQEIAGRIDAVGPGVAGFAPGERVIAPVRGGFAQFVLAEAGQVLKMPAAMSFEQGAGFRVNYLTALHGLRDRAQLAPGERLLVLGAAGGVGLAAVQVGRALGAEVIAAASTEAKRAHATAHGAHRTLDTEPEGWRDRLKDACGGRGPDVVFDPVCGPLFQPAFRSLAWRGRHLVIGFVGGPIPALPANLTLLKGAALTGVDVRQFLLFEPDRARSQLEELLGWVGEGRLVPPVGRVFPLAEYVTALEFALTGQGLGKSVLAIA